AGKVDALLSQVSQREPYMKETQVYDTLKRAAQWIIPLNLINPKAPNFNPSGCQSLHDIMRYVHEVSYGEMFKLSDVVSSGPGTALKLHASIPLDLHIIDLGGGLQGLKPGAKKANADQVICIPFKHLLKGMLHEDLICRGPRPIELKGFFSVMSQQMLTPPNLAAERFGDRSYAIISDKYLNFSSRVGYHYSVLDSYCGDTVNKNYITFTFMGGAADETRRNRRARLIAEILRELHFSVDVVADRITARFQKYERSLTEERLDLLGRLLQYTRQMDMIMNNEQSVLDLATRFLKGNYNLD
ncbi:MAG: phosphoenolpyruvate synthase, partial [Desulforhabdus sp.]|nr:phosphoenolpyruvate synthase [Desulforhabdus sp.]